jgi:HAE1 family hydrophobic/amphiphilic exporter-1
MAWVNKGVAIGIFQTSGSNAQDIITEVMELKKQTKFPLRGGLCYSYNTK